MASMAMAKKSGLWSFAKYMVLASAVYEPLRNALHRYGTAVGGVGGVGGLCNMGNPEDCKSLAGETGNYCFYPGVWAGFTGFALVVLLVWTAPLLLGALRMSMKEASEVQRERIAERSEEGSEDSGEGAERALLQIWSGLSLLWFVVPFGYFIADPFFRKNVSTIILAVAIAAAYPLSWHLSLTAMLSKKVQPLMGLDRPGIVALHKALGWRSAAWSGVHIIGELIFIISTSGLGALFNLVGKNGENLLYLLGILSAALMCLHVAVVTVRKNSWFNPYFLGLHRVIAIGLLLAATAHWWPFVFFLLPTVSVHAMGTANHVVKQFHREASTPRLSFALFTALIGAFGGLALVWSFRAKIMAAPDVGLLLPFAFPPLALLAEFLGAFAAATSVLFMSPKGGEVELHTQLVA